MKRSVTEQMLWQFGGTHTYTKRETHQTNDQKRAQQQSRIAATSNLSPNKLTQWKLHGLHTNCQIDRVYN